MRLQGIRFWSGWPIMAPSCCNGTTMALCCVSCVGGLWGVFASQQTDDRPRCCCCCCCCEQQLRDSPYAVQRRGLLSRWLEEKFVFFQLELNETGLTFENNASSTSKISIFGGKAPCLCSFSSVRTS
jgi:hypothetical protein